MPAYRKLTNHCLAPGDSLLGITVDDLLRGFYRKKLKKALTGDDPPQGELPFYFTRVELDARLSRAFRHLHEIQRLETEQPGDFEDQQTAWFTMRQKLADFREAHSLRIGRAFLEDTDPAVDPLLANAGCRRFRTSTALARRRGLRRRKPSQRATRFVPFVGNWHVHWARPNPDPAGWTHSPDHMAQLLERYPDRTCTC
jgi:hypothetical protein